MTTIDIPMHPNRAKQHIPSWAGRVTAVYSLAEGTLYLTAGVVGERWVIRALPATALKLARSFRARVRVR